MKRPSNLLFAPDERPTRSVTLMVGLQLFMTVATNLVYPLVILRTAHASSVTTASVLSITLIVAAIGTLLQAQRHSLFGSGFLAPMSPTAIYFGPSMVAATLGGLPLVFAMTIVAGVVEMAVSRVLTKLRAILPPEVAGTVVFLVGMSIVVVGVRNLADPMHGQTPPANHWYVAAITFVIMIGLSIWGNQMFRTFAVLIGIIAGYAVDVALHGFRMPDLDLTGVPIVGAPSLSHIHYDFSAVVVPAFIVAGVAAALKTVGLLTVSQKCNDADWVRPDMTNMSRGVMADGMTTTLSGLAGTVGMNIVASSIAISASIGVQSRAIAYVIAGICVLLAFCPYSTLVLTTVPAAVIAVTVLMLGSFIMVSGLQLIVSRLLDVRRTLVVGMAIAAALLIEIVPSVANTVPPVLRPFLSSPLGFGTVIALIFNLVFRLGTRRKLVLAIEPANYTPTAIEDFFNINGAQWGARPDVIARATFGTNQAVEALIENCELRDNVKLNTSFDEFNLEVYLSWHGLPLDLPDQRPSNKEIMESDDGPRRLAGYLLRRNADRATFAKRGEECELHFHFDH